MKRYYHLEVQDENASTCAKLDGAMAMSQDLPGSMQPRLELVGRCGTSRLLSRWHFELSERERER